MLLRNINLGKVIVELGKAVNKVYFRDNNYNYLVVDGLKVEDGQIVVYYDGYSERTYDYDDLSEELEFFQIIDEKN